MPRQKTLLTPREQWLRTVEYASQCSYVASAQYRARAQGEPAQSVEQWRAQWRAQGDVQLQTLDCIMPHNTMLWCYRDTHKCLVAGDVLFWTNSNGMNERFGFTGVTSKGVQLNDFYLPIRSASASNVSAYAVVQFPDDFKDKRCDDPQVFEFIMGWRSRTHDECLVGLDGSSTRGGAAHHLNSALQSAQPSTPDNTTAQGLRFDGVYKSRRLAGRHVRSAYTDERQYLRFMPDGQVWAALFTHELTGHNLCRETVHAQVQWAGNQLQFALQYGEEVVARYAGTLRDGRLYLREEGCSFYWGEAHREHVFSFVPQDMSYS